MVREPFGAGLLGLGLMGRRGTTAEAKISFRVA